MAERPRNRCGTEISRPHKLLCFSRFRLKRSIDKQFTASRFTDLLRDLSAISFCRRPRPRNANMIDSPLRRLASMIVANPGNIAPPPDGVTSFTYEDDLAISHAYDFVGLTTKTKHPAIYRGCFQVATSRAPEFIATKPECGGREI